MSTSPEIQLSVRARRPNVLLSLRELTAPSKGQEADGGRFSTGISWSKMNGLHARTCGNVVHKTRTL